MWATRTLYSISLSSPVIQETLKNTPIIVSLSPNIMLLHCNEHIYQPIHLFP